MVFVLCIFPHSNFPFHVCRSPLNTENILPQQCCLDREDLCHAGFVTFGNQKYNCHSQFLQQMARCENGNSSKYSNSNDFLFIHYILSPTVHVHWQSLSFIHLVLKQLANYPIKHSRNKWFLRWLLCLLFPTSLVWGSQVAWVLPPCSANFGLPRICLQNFRPFLYCLCS